MDLRRCDRTRAKVSSPGRETLNQEQVFEDLYVGVTGSRFEAGVASGGPDVEHLIYDGRSGAGVSVRLRPRD